MEQFLSEIIDIENLVSEGKISDQEAIMALIGRDVPLNTALSMVSLAKD